MIVTRKSLPRRTFLRGVGATLALPLLDAMVPAFAAAARSAASPVRRLGFIYIPNGAIMEKWTPAREGKLELSPTLSPLASVRDRLVVVSNLTSRPAEAAEGEGSGDHARASAVWLSGTHPKRTEGADVRAGRTIDQIAADTLGEGTQLRSLELSVEDFTNAVGSCDIGYACSYVNTLSWRTATAPQPMQTNPRVVFERLFGDQRDPRKRDQQLREDGSILDAIADQASRLRKRVGTADNARVTEYLDSVREVEKRVATMTEQSIDQLTLPEIPSGVPDSYDEHVKLMLDLQVLAYQADITRVGTLQLGREASTRSYAHIGVPDPHHAISHHGYVPELMERVQKINQYHVSLLGYYLDKLASTPDGDSTLLDQSLILYGGCISDGNLHSHVSLPALLAGGAAGELEGGRHLRYADDTPHANLLVSMLQKSGLDIEQIGDSTGSLTRL
ncbi:MAG: DUF1552 domain-containing protein [Acidobacteriota bacterium]|nr:DUF1552 domain-containing protein [Acidobacteriota bacterium]